MKTMLQAAKSGYCTSVASEMGTKGDKSGQKGIKCKKRAQKFHSEAETACSRPKLPARAVHVMKTMLQAAYSGYFTSVASENVVLVMKIGPEGDKLKNRAQKFHSEAETAC